MRYLPLFFDVKDRPVLLIGTGAAADAKARLLDKAGARILRRADFDPADMRDACAVVAAIEAPEQVAATVKAAGLPFNAVDRPELSTFIVPAIVDRGDVVIGISSAGTAPVLARRIRARIEALVPENTGKLARFLDRFRGAVKATVPAHARRRFWEGVIDGAVGRAVLDGNERQGAEAMLDALNRPDWSRPASGVVQLVGAGPGDPDLLTLKALRALQDADVIVHDRLVAPAILDYARRDAERIDVGKAPGDHRLDQDGINALLADLAREGQRVVRLKGGDPMVFGRGGEELEYLMARGIAVEVVPGITAALGCAASAGLSLTHRLAANGCTVVSATAREGGDAPDWAALASARHTVVFYMGVGAARTIADALTAHGRAADTAVAVIENGTRADERVVSSTLADLPGLVARHAIAAPALIVVGEVVARAPFHSARVAGAARDARVAGVARDSRVAGAARDARVAGAARDARSAVAV